MMAELVPRLACALTFLPPPPPSSKPPLPSDLSVRTIHVTGGTQNTHCRSREKRKKHSNQGNGKETDSMLTSRQRRGGRTDGAEGGGGRGKGGSRSAGRRVGGWETYKHKQETPPTRRSYMPPCAYASPREALYLATALVPSLMACFASSGGSSRRADV